MANFRLRDSAATPSAGARRAAEAMIAGHDFAIVDLVRIDVPVGQELRAPKESSKEDSIRSPAPDESEHDFESGNSGIRLRYLTPVTKRRGPMHNTSNQCDHRNIQIP